MLSFCLVLTQERLQQDLAFLPELCFQALLQLPSATLQFPLVLRIERFLLLLLRLEHLYGISVGQVALLRVLCEISSEALESRMIRRLLLENDLAAALDDGPCLSGKVDLTEACGLVRLL